MDMFSFLPDLTPRDSHTLWYESTRHGYLSHVDDYAKLDSDESLASLPPLNAPGGTATSAHVRRVGGHLASAAAIERTPLGRLRADEQYQERRRANVANFGATWLKPPGVGKTLFQMREERREQEEHAEALRREQAAQELVEAEGGGLAGGGDVRLPGVATLLGVAGLDGEEGSDGEPMEGVDGGRDLDDDIPDADAEGFGYDGVGSDDGGEEDGEDSSASDDNGLIDGGGRGGSSNDTVGPNPHGLTPVQHREMQSRMSTFRATEDRVREMIARGQRDGGEIYGSDWEVVEGDPAHMLEEEDFVPQRHDGQIEPGADFDMNANLDDDIPEAEGEGYEHTDSEAELSSSPAAQDTEASRIRRSMDISSILSRDRTSMDISSILSRDTSSAMGSSPHPGRRN